MISDALVPPSPAIGPEEWTDALLAALRDEQLGFVEGDVAWRVVSFADVVASEPGWLAEHFARQMGAGQPAQTAATHLAGWYAGALGWVVGTALAAGPVGAVPRADSVRWFVHPDGWVSHVDADLDLTVAEGQPWAGRPGVSVVPDERAVATSAVDGLVSVCRPILDACRRLTRVGEAGLWNEVCDSIGMTLVYQRSIDPTPERVAALQAAIDRADAPWRRRTRLWFVDDPQLGHLHVGQKGGCCLAYLGDEADDEDEQDEVDAATGRTYCTTCSLRAVDECVQSQISWHLDRRP